MFQEYGNSMSGGTQRREKTKDPASIDRVDPKDLKIAYVGGGSRLWSRTLINDLAQTETLSGDVYLYDIDYSSAKKNARLGNQVQNREDVPSDWTYTAVKKRADGLKDANFVFTSTQYDPKETFVPDLEIPKKYGIYGAVSATIGPGGILRAMRTIPVYREIAEAIREHCPHAWVLNYTNPVTFVTRTLYEEYPDINAIGLCHEVFHAQKFLASIVSEYHDIEHPPRDEIDINVKGINHFTWIDRASWNGEDLFPLVDWYMDQEGSVRKYSPEDLEDASGFVDNNQVTLELYKLFGILPAAGDRHLVEYAPWFMRGDMPEDLNRWGVKRTTSEYRASHWGNGKREIEKLLEGDEKGDITKSGEVMTDIIKALTGQKTFLTNVNLPNHGQIQGLPEGAVVETNARISENTIVPIVSGSFPRPLQNLVQTHIQNQETVIEAAFDGGNVDYAFQAFLNDPQVLALQPETAQKMFAELIVAEKEYLQEWDLENSKILAETNLFSNDDT